MATPNVSATDGISTSGRVKWFNNKAGYGFITVSAGEHDGTDVFVHHSAIQVAVEQYRYLVQGEYVVFSLCSVENDKHQWQAGTVKGISNGKLMCETRLETREARPETARTTGPRTTGSRVTRVPEDTDGQSPPQYRVRLDRSSSRPREGDEFVLIRAAGHQASRTPSRTPSRAPSRLSSPSDQMQVLRSRPVKAPYKEPTE